MKKKILIGLIISILIVVGIIFIIRSFTKPAEINWVQTSGPQGGRIFRLFQNPYKHNELYAVTEMGVYKSENKGENWEIMKYSTFSQPPISIAFTEDKVFACGGFGIFYYDNRGSVRPNLLNINNIIRGGGECNDLKISNNKLFATFSTPSPKDSKKIIYTDLNSGFFIWKDWKDISPSESELKDLILPPEDAPFGRVIRIPHILVTDNRILANIIAESFGSGEFTNGNLYISEDLGQTWSKVDLDTPKDIIISNIIQDQNDREHIILAFKHILHDSYHPLSEFLRESYDGGLTWAPLTDITFDNNAVGDVDITESSYYITLQKGNFIIKLDKLDTSKYELIEMPRAEGYDKDIPFTLAELLFDFDNQNIVYGRTNEMWAFGLVKSEDNMKTWKKIDRDIIRSSPTIVVVHPTNPDIIFTSGNTAHEAYFTKDGGQTWEPFSKFTFGDELKFDPHDPNHLIFIDENTKIMESYDLGKTWKQINSGFGGEEEKSNFTSAKIFDFEVAGDKIYVSNTGVGISEYNPKDNSWHYLLHSPDYVYDFEIDPEDNNILYASYSPKIFENYSSVWKYSPSQEENLGWSEILRVEDSKGITSLRFDPQNPNRIYAGVTGREGEIYVSNDKGKTWSKLNDELTFTTIMRHSQLQVDPKNKNTVYAGTWGGGTYKSTDGGKNWVKLEGAPESPTCLAIYEKDPNIIYACDRTKPVIHKSEDGGHTWQEYYKFDRSNVLTSAIAINPNDSDTIYAATFGLPFCVEAGELVKIKNGVVVADLNKNLPGIKEGIPEAAVEIEIDPNNPNTIYVSKHGYGVFKSIDDGETWKRLDDREGGLPRLGYYDIDVDYSNSNTLYAAGLCELLPEYIIGPTGLPQNIEQGACGAYKSTDGGKNWTRMLETDHATMAVEVDPQNPNLLYVATGAQGIFVSSDGGKSWKQENKGLPSFGTAAVIAKDGYVYAGVGGSGVYAGIINDDYSITWDKSRSNKPKAYVSKIQIEIDPKDSTRIYASAYPGGMFRSDDKGKTWYERNTSQPSIIVDDPVRQGYYSFAIDPNHPADIWQGVYGKGLFRSHEYMNVSMFANGDKNEMLGKHITAVVIDPRDSKTVYVGTQEGVFVTKDDGKSWSEMNEGLETLDILSLKIASVEYPPFEDDFEDGNADGWERGGDWRVVQYNGNYVLQGIDHNWSTVGSESWTDYTFESKVKLIKGSLHINYRISQVGRYAIGVSEGGLYLMKTIFPDNHINLVNIGFPLEKNTWNKIKIIGKGNNTKVYVNNVLKINYTDSEPLLNGRIGFESHPDSKVYVDDVQVTPERVDSVLYAGTAGYGLYKFYPATKKWQNLGRTLGIGWWSAWDRRMYQFTSILFDPDIPGRVYLGHFPSGFFISEDNGHTWKDSSLGLGNDGMFSLTMHPTNHDVLFAGTYNGVSKSVDRGKTWVIKSNGMPPEQWPYTVAIDDQDPNIMYVSTKNGKNKGFCDRNFDTFCGVVMKSTDGGETWFEIMKGLNRKSEFYKLIIYPLNHNILFLSTNRGVYLSKNAGESWKSINNGLPGLCKTKASMCNQVRDNVADNLILTPDNKYLILGLAMNGVWKADLSKLSP
ncbi:hypothetical protein AMJ49_01075 [Parcubacteria bacterium DG_74_2]|nr:MAG: hypothetical protein AMJ49_01075 [Parcubacteria bacterium DG_74_2]